MLTRMGEAEDWGTGVPLKANMLGMMNHLEVHHIFPKSRLYIVDYGRAEVNAVANFCFLTKETKLVIGDRLPEEYFAEIEKNHPGALASQWIPLDTALWRLDRYRDFLEARKTLLADEANTRFADLLHGETGWISAPSPEIAEPALAPLGGLPPKPKKRSWKRSTIGWKHSAFRVGNWDSTMPTRRPARRRRCSTSHGRRGCSQV